MDPCRYRNSFTLRSGTKVTLRAIRPDDGERLRRAFSGLDERSVYSRFFGAKSALTDAELKAATEIDFDRDVALVAVLEADAETVIAGGRYARLPAPAGGQAEVAFTVEEDYQGQGLASLILRELATLARPAGVATFVAEVLPSNAAMLHVFRRSGFPVTVRSLDGVMHVELDLTDGEGAAA